MFLALQYVRSAIFIVLMYATMALYAVFFTPWAVFDRRDLMVW